MPLPSSITYGTVKGRFILAVADTADADTQPDAVSATGTIKFTPSISHTVLASEDPPVFISPRTVNCTLDSDGYLLGPNGVRNVVLVASDNAAMNPRDWTYKVEITIAGMTVAPFNLLVEGGVTKDLALSI